MVEREDAYECATTAIPSSKPMNVDKLPGSGQAGKVASMLTTFDLLLV